MTDDNESARRSLTQRLKDSAASAARLVKSVIQFDAFAKFKAGSTEIDFRLSSE